MHVTPMQIYGFIYASCKYVNSGFIYSDWNEIINVFFVGKNKRRSSLVTDSSTWF